MIVFVALGLSHRECDGQLERTEKPFQVRRVLASCIQMHMKVRLRMLVMQLFKPITQKVKSLRVLGDGHRGSGWLPIVSQKIDTMTISSCVNADADVRNGRQSGVVSHPSLLIANGSPFLCSHETPPVIFGLGNPCDKRSRRIMYQFLTPKVGGQNLSQEVKPQGEGNSSSRLHSAPICHDLEHCGMTGIEHTRGMRCKEATLKPFVGTLRVESPCGNA